MKTAHIVLLTLGSIIAIPGGIIGCYALRTGAVMLQEVDPRTVLDRHNWFIDTWNAVQEQDATMNAYKAEVKDVDVVSLPRDMRQDYALKKAEIRGILANRNRLAREYRANMQKFNYVPATMLPLFPETIPDYSL